MIDEFGGIKWAEIDETQYSDGNSWGYGTPPQSKEEFYLRVRQLVEAIRNLPHIQGFCYTQLTDIEQEQNGIYNYDRTLKFDMERIRLIFAQVPMS